MYGRLVGFTHLHRSLSWRAWAGLLVKAVEGTLLRQTRLLIKPLLFHTIAYYTILFGHLPFSHRLSRLRIPNNLKWIVDILPASKLYSGNILADKVVRFMEIRGKKLIPPLYMLSASLNLSNGIICRYLFSWPRNSSSSTALLLVTPRLRSLEIYYNVLWETYVIANFPAIITSLFSNSCDSMSEQLKYGGPNLSHTHALT